VRGRGLLWGVEAAAAGAAAAWARRALGAGIIALPAGTDGRVLELLPPAVLTRRQLAVALAALRRTAPPG
jgi:4-aminobutyrate aminotransferase-like enzyme